MQFTTWVADANISYYFIHSPFLIIYKMKHKIIFSSLFFLLHFFHAHSQNITAAGSLATGRYGHEVQKLTNGKILAFGGSTMDGAGVTTYYASAELYNETTNTWQATGAMNKPRYEFASVLLADGKVLAIGGLTGGGDVLNSCEIYNPTTGLWTYTDSMNNDRYQHGATLLSNGKVLVVGGDNGGNTYELYDPSTGQWASQGTTNFYHSTNSSAGDGFYLLNLANNKVYAISPSNSELYDPTTNTWSTNAPTVPQYSHEVYAVSLNNNKVLIAGDSSGKYRSVLYDVTTNSLVAGSARVVDNFVHYDLIKAANGNVFTFGARSFANMTSSNFARLYNVTDNQWHTAGTISLAYQGAMDYKGVLLNNNKILTVGGYTGTLNGTTACYLVNANNMSVGIMEEAEEGAFNIFPNPSSGEFTLSLKSQNEPLVSYTIFNMMGQKIQEANFENGSDLDQHISIAQSGCYTLLIRSKDKVFSKQLIVTK